MSLAFQQLFATFSDVCRRETDTQRLQLTQLAAAAAQQGLVGAAFALPQLRALSCLLRAELAGEPLFSIFYRFAFFVARERGERSLRNSTAVEAWRVVLPGRFRLLDAFVRFVATSGRAVISEDTWLQTLAFSRCVLPRHGSTLSSFSGADSWFSCNADAPPQYDSRGPLKLRNHGRCAPSAPCLTMLPAG